MQILYHVDILCAFGDQPMPDSNPKHFSWNPLIGFSTYLGGAGVVFLVAKSAGMERYLEDEIWLWVLSILLPAVGFVIFHWGKKLVMLFAWKIKKILAIEVRVRLLNRFFGVKDFGDCKQSSQGWKLQPDRFDIYNRIHFNNGAACQYEFLLNYEGLIVRKKPVGTDWFDSETKQAPTGKDFMILVFASRFFPRWALSHYVRFLVNWVWEILP
jgi:hypothetical protein